MRRVAVVLDGHGWPVRACVRSLGSAGWFVVAPSGTKSARSHYTAARFDLPSYTRDVEAWTDAVGGAIRRHGASLVVPAEDASLELLYGTEGLLDGAHVLGGSRESVAWVLDKAETLRRAEAAGFAAPRHVVPGSVEEAVAAGTDLGYPCVVKPRRSYARRGRALKSARLAIVRSERELRRAVERFVARGFGLPTVQAWTPGRSFGVAAVVHEGRILAWGVREAFSQTPIRGGSAVWRRTVGIDAPGVRDALRLFADLGFEGFGDVQYHVDAEGTPRLMEMGARPYGWLPLTILAGADLPLVFARMLEGVEPEETIAARPGLDMRWPKGELYRLLELLNPRLELPPGAGRLDVVRQLWPLWGPSMHYDGIRFGDRPRGRLRRAGRAAGGSPAGPPAPGPTAARS